ncbi:MAG: rhomboid family intramembrane serine protease [Phycisphaerales bacterium JB059]
MLIPLGTDRPTRRPSLVTPAILAVTVLAHLVMQVVLRVDPERGAWVYDTFSVGGAEFRWWGLLTSLLLHSPASWLHLIANMLFLWVFGPSVEDRFGRLGFLALYLLGGVASGGLHAAFEPSPAIGASGAIAAIAGAFLVLFPRTRIKCFWIFTLSVIPVPAWWFIGLAVAWDLLAHAFQAADNIARLAHLGGYAFGIGVSAALLRAGVFPSEPYDLLTIFRQARRRRAFRAAGAMANHSAPAAAKAKGDRHAHQSDALAGARAEVSEALSRGELDLAADRYRELLSEYADQPGAATLARDAQYRLGVHLAAAGDHETAAIAFERFVEAYPLDREIEQIRLMLGRLLGRYLGRRERGLELLTEVMNQTHDEELRAIAREEIEHLREDAA